ncbi:MAG: hypothetical protein OXC40_01825, partial [Proteobacteria bacterium]|nr:hypothetical protein [Pseudomonadota bacterium]
MNYRITLKGIATHNLKHCDVSLPLGKLITVSGVSGSGKTSLVFHTLHAESYRRYIDSLSSFARQYLKSMPKPLIKEAHGLPPSIAVKQGTGGYNWRSTVGSFTEISHLLKVIFSYECQVVCPNGHGSLYTDTEDSIAKYLQAHYHNTQITIEAPLKKLMNSALPENRNNPLINMITFLKEQGFVRMRNPEGKILRLGQLDVKNQESIGDPSLCRVIIDRFNVTKDNTPRMTDAIRSALAIGKGRLDIRDHQENNKQFQTYLACGQCDFQAPPPSIHLFSTQHPLGACEVCQGFGQASLWDWDKIIGNAENVTHLDFFKKPAAKYYYQAFLAEFKQKISPHKKLANYSAQDYHWLKWGCLAARDLADESFDAEPAKTQ